ncbi:MAG: hypothetical protein AAF211_06890 [Myxococcota bacterium]
MAEQHPVRGFPFVQIRLSDGTSRRVPSGGLVGRLAAAAVRIEDPRVSEAHAMISLRGTRFVMLALRGTTRVVDEDPRRRIDLEVGQRIELHAEIIVEVEAIEVPPLVMAIAGIEGSPVPLDGPEFSIVDDPLRVVPEPHRERLAWCWCTEGQWWLGLPGETPEPIEVGHEATIAGQTLRWVEVPTERAVSRTTTIQSFWPPLRLVVHDEHTDVSVRGMPELRRLTGNNHAIVHALSSLVADGGSVHWQRVAEEIWPVNHHSYNWYTALARLRKHLGKVGLPEELVDTDQGQVWLALRPGVDTVERRVSG